MLLLSLLFMLVVEVDVGPSAVHVGNIVQGARLAWAQGRDIGMIDEDSDTAKKVKQIQYHILLLDLFVYYNSLLSFLEIQNKI